MTSKRGNTRSAHGRFFPWAALLLLGALIGGFAVAVLMRSTHVVVSTAGVQSAPTLMTETAPADEREPDASGAEPVPEETVETAASLDKMPMLAIVMDDCGGNLALARRVKSLDLPLTWAILPHLQYSAKTAEMLRSADIPFLIHVPMQAVSDPDGRAGQRGQYAIGVDMEEAAVRKALVPILDSLPGAYGINNHRGSKATADASVMKAVMKVLAERSMFFLDSSTTPKTVAYKTALGQGLIARKNGHFLDNESDREKIASEVEHATKVAARRGSLIAICHLRPETVAFLENYATRIAAEDRVRLVTLPQMVEYQKERVR